MTSARIVSLGEYFPERVLANADLETILDTTNEWIVGRTGIGERRICAPHETNQTMAVEAARVALAKVQSPHPIEYIFVATNTSERKFPSTAMYVARALHEWRDDLVVPRVSGMDVEAGCAGINHALMVADFSIRAGMYRSVLVIGTDCLSSVTDYADRQTAVLFGDGAGAYLLSASDDHGFGFVGHEMSGKPDGYEQISCKEGAEKLTILEAFAAKREGRGPVPTQGPVLFMDGKKVYEYVVKLLDALVKGFPNNRKLNPHAIPFDDVKAIAPHQANLRMLEGMDSRHPGFLKKCRITIDRYGNTSTASQILAVMDILENEAKRGDYVLFVGYGAGLTGGANLYRVP